MTEAGIIGLDLGGTDIKGLLVDEQGAVLGRAVLKTEAEQGPGHVIQRMHQVAQILCDNVGCAMDKVIGIGVGSPGPLKIREGLIIKSANLPDWDQVPLRDELQALSGRPVFLENDANAAALGEYWRGAGKGADHLCLLTLGTGVGGGLVQKGEVLHGHFDNAGELGHMIVFPGGHECGCGQKGCLEAYAGGTHIVKQALKRLSAGEGTYLRRIFTQKTKLEVRNIVEAAARRDSLAADLWNQACLAIAIACVNLQHAFNPQRILLGGGVAAAGDALFQPVRNQFSQLVWNLADDAPEILPAQLGNDAGAIGAAYGLWRLRR